MLISVGIVIRRVTSMPIGMPGRAGAGPGPVGAAVGTADAVGTAVGSGVAVGRGVDTADAAGGV